MSSSDGSDAMDRDVLVLTGATTTGKSALSIEVARRVGAEIISMDSRQVYRGMDIGTAKLSVSERAGVPHHGLDLVDPDQRYSAGHFARDAWRWIAGIRRRGRPVLLVGGTGFFLRALTHPFFREPELPEDRRLALARYLAHVPEENLQRWAASLETEGQLPIDRQRLSRIIEVGTLSGYSLGWWHRNAPPVHRPLDAPIVVLEMPRPLLRERIDNRALDMVRHGLLDEVRGLRDSGCDRTAPAMNATGYREMIDHLENRVTLENAIASMQLATRHYARRQTTWFRHQLPSGAVRLDGTRPLDELADTVERVFTGEEVTV